jgi:hypothetical protein
MAKKMNAKGRRSSGTFLALPHNLIDAPKFQDLSGNATKLLIQIAGKYRGKNNGDLSASFKTMKASGWRSETTLNKALKELLDKGFLVKTRQGHFPKKCCLYGITWRAIDPSTKYDTQQYTGKNLAWWKN